MKGDFLKMKVTGEFEKSFSLTAAVQVVVSPCRLQERLDISSILVCIRE